MQEIRENAALKDGDEEIYKYEDFNTYTQLPTEQMVLSVKAVSET